MNKKLNSFRVFSVFLTLVFPVVTVMSLYSDSVQLFVMWLMVTAVIIFRIKTIKLLFNKSKISRSYIYSIMFSALISFVMCGIYFIFKI